MLYICVFIVFQFGHPDDDWENDKEDPKGRTPGQKAKGFFFKGSKLMAKVSKVVADTGLIEGPIGDVLGGVAEIVETVVEEEEGEGEEK